MQLIQVGTLIHFNKQVQKIPLVKVSSREFEEAQKNLLKNATKLIVSNFQNIDFKAMKHTRLE